MHLKESQTLLNLARSFAGEAQAGLRYQFTADKALNEGYKILSDEIRKIAKNEVNHAKVFFELITDNVGNTDNIEFTAGYPFEGTTLEEGLKFAIKEEEDEVEIYQNFAKVADEEGFTEIANINKRFSNFSTKFAPVGINKAKNTFKYKKSENM